MSGAETGTLGDEIQSASGVTLTTNSSGSLLCRSGKWCYAFTESQRTAAASCVTNCPSSTGNALFTGATTLYMRAAFRIDVTANPTSAIQGKILYATSHSSSVQMSIPTNAVSGGTVTLLSVLSGTSDKTAVVTTGAWHQLDYVVTSSSAQLWVDGTDLGVQSATNSGTSTSISFGFAPSLTNSATWTARWDDLAVSTAAWPAGWTGATTGFTMRVLSRQGRSASGEAYTDWNGTTVGCTAGTNPDGCWSDSPADTSTYIRSGASGAKRTTMFVDSFVAGATGSAQTFGNYSGLGARDQVCGCKVTGVAKKVTGTPPDPFFYLMTRLNSVDKDWLVSDVLTTTFTAYSTPTFYATSSVLEAAEIGGYRVAGTSVEAQIADAWMQCAAVPAPPFVMRVK